MLTRGNFRVAMAVSTLVAAFAAATAVSHAAAADYPTRPITLIVPYPRRWRRNDVIARLVAAKMTGSSSAGKSSLKIAAVPAAPLALEMSPEARRTVTPC